MATSAPRGRGVDVVLVEVTQLLGEQLGQAPALERDGPVGLPGGGEHAEPAVGAAMRIGPSLVSSPTSVMPGPSELRRVRGTLSRSASQARAGRRWG